MRSKRFAAALLMAGCMWVLLGCRSARVPDSTLPGLAGNAPETQLEFWHTLATKPLVSNDEAFHALLLYVDGQDPAQSYADRVKQLKSRGMLGDGFNEPADAALNRGTLAVALVKTLDLKDGVTLRLFGNNARYATRELEYQGIYPASSPNQVFSGASFVGVIGKAEDYVHGNPADYPASVMPSEIRGNKRPRPEPNNLAARQDEPEHLAPIFAMMQADNLSLRPATVPAATTTSPTNKRAIVSAVEGLTSYRENETAKWKPLVKGIELNEQSELRTGPNGAIQLVIPPDETVAVDRLTTVKLLRIFREGNKATTDVGFKYGRTRYDLEGGGIEHQSTLRSPNATLAVRGTRVSLFDQPPFVPQAISLTGRAQFQGFRKQAIAFGNAGQGKTKINTGAASSGEVAVTESLVDPILPGARTTSELPLVSSLVSRGATITIDRTAGIEIVSGGKRPKDKDLLGLLPGGLNFVLRWDGDANLDLAVSTPGTASSPGGEFIFPVKGFDISPSGGKILFDHRGGPAGGIEIVNFPKSHPQGIYAMAAPSHSSNLVNATLQAFLDGAPLDVSDGLTTSKRVDQVVGNPVPGPGLALVNVESLFPFSAGRSVTPRARLSGVKKPFNLLDPPPMQMVGPKPPEATKKTAGR